MTTSPPPWTVAFGLFMQTLDTTIVNSALLSMSIGVPLAGLLPDTFAHRAVTDDSPLAHQAFMATRLCMALIIALPARIFRRVPADTAPDAPLARRRKH